MPTSNCEKGIKKENEVCSFCSFFSFPGAWKEVQPPPWFQTLEKVLYNHSLILTVFHESLRKTQEKASEWVPGDTELGQTPESSCDTIETRVAHLSTEVLLSYVFSYMSAWESSFHKPLTKFWNQVERTLGRQMTPYFPSFHGGELSSSRLWAVTTRKMNPWRLC